jgi:hypothetical protein
MKIWNEKGLKTSLTRGKRSPAPEASPDSVFKLGAAIPIFSRLYIGARIRSREGAISKVGRKLDKMVSRESIKIEKTIAAAEKTDIHSLVQRARSLRDKLEKAACADVKFRETAEEEEEAAKPGRPPKKEHLSTLCIRAIADKLFGKAPTGMTKGKMKEGTASFSDPDLQNQLERCVTAGGKIKISAVTVKLLTSDAKDTDVDIDVSRGI